MFTSDSMNQGHGGPASNAGGHWFNLWSPYAKRRENGTSKLPYTSVGLMKINCHTHVQTMGGVYRVYNSKQCSCNIVTTQVILLQYKYSDKNKFKIHIYYTTAKGDIFLVSRFQVCIVMYRGYSNTFSDSSSFYDIEICVIYLKSSLNTPGYYYNISVFTETQQPLVFDRHLLKYLK